MSMRVKMIMDLVANTRKGAQQAKRDMAGVKDAAKSLDGVQAGRRISRDFLSLVGLSRRATQSMREAKVAADALGRSEGPRRLSKQLGQMTAMIRSSRGVAPAAAAALTPGLKGAVGGYFTARAAMDSVKRHAEAERAITRIGVTADASKEALASVGETAFKIAQEVAMPYDKVVQGLDVLVAQGRSLKDAMAFLSPVARTASATGAEVDDIARTADSVGSNFKIAGDQMQRAFDIMAAGGKAGQFELKDMARYLPSLGPAAAAAGFTGENGLRDLVSMLQVMRKGSGTSEEAAASMQNVLQKMMSEETAKRFKKFGVDLPKAMDKARAEGRNLVEVFEELTHTALKGDLSKIPQLINDMEFARGIRALASYRGEWQKLSGTIQKTAAGSVANDLAKVTDNVQARLDQLANTFGKRMRQLGAVISDVLVPLDKKIDEVMSGKSDGFNAVEKAAQRYNSDLIAREEMQTGQRGDYDDETRRVADARRALLERQAFDDAVARLDSEIASKEANLNATAARTQGAGKARQDTLLAEPRKALASLQAQRDALIQLRKAIDEANVSLAENEAQRKRLNTRFNGGVQAPQPIASGLNSFGFGPQGQKAVRDALPVETETIAPLPPPRPASLPGPVQSLNSFDDIYASPKIPLKDWAGKVLRAEGLDFSGIGLTIAESVAQGVESGKSSVSGAAAGLGDAARSALGVVDFSAAGRQAGNSFANGLLESRGAVSAAARKLADSAGGSGGRQSLSGALHDGVE